MAGPDYVSHLLRYGRAALNKAVKQKVIHYNYAKDVRRPKTKPRDERASNEEVAAILHYFLSQGRRKDSLIN